MDEDEFTVRPTPHGVLFSRFMVRFDSMKALMSVSEQHTTRLAASDSGGTCDRARKNDVLGPRRAKHKEAGEAGECLR